MTCYKKSTESQEICSTLDETSCCLTLYLFSQDMILTEWFKYALKRLTVARVGPLTLLAIWRNSISHSFAFDDTTWRNSLCCDAIHCKDDAYFVPGIQHASFWHTTYIDSWRMTTCAAEGRIAIADLKINQVCGFEKQDSTRCSTEIGVLALWGAVQNTARSTEFVVADRCSADERDPVLIAKCIGEKPKVHSLRRLTYR